MDFLGLWRQHENSEAVQRLLASVHCDACTRTPGTATPGLVGGEGTTSTTATTMMMTVHTVSKSLRFLLHTIAECLGIPSLSYLDHTPALEMVWLEMRVVSRQGASPSDTDGIVRVDRAMRVLP